MGEVEGMSAGAKKREWGMVVRGSSVGRGVERQHMTGARVHRGDKMEGTRHDSSMPQDRGRDGRHYSKG